jgi:hypothetical protein
MSGFAQWQREYAARGLITFPVRIVDGDKKPAVGNYLRIGPNGSAALARKYPDMSAFGFALGRRSNITILDVDTNDERVLADAMGRHGKTPLVVRSGSGNFQAWYRHGGERRHIRPDIARPIDVLGGGFTVAPPSRGIKLPYQIISGSLDDLAALPPLRNFVPPSDFGGPQGGIVPYGLRNRELFRHCMRSARSCDDFATLCDVAETFAAQCEQRPDAPLTTDEIRNTALSAWQYTQRGANWIGAEHTHFDRATFPPCGLSSDPFLFTLLCWLRDHDGPGRSIMIADALADILGWSKHQLRETRRRAVSGAWVVLVELPTRTRAARFAWGPASKEHGLQIPEAIPLASEGTGSKEGGRGVYSQVWNPEAIPSPSVGGAP